MDRRVNIELLVAILLIIIGTIITILPVFSIVNVKTVFTIIISLYGVIHLIKNVLILKSKDYSGFGIAFSSIVILVLLMFIDINDSPWNLALLQFIWIILLSLNKLKESDYYHDRKNKLWILNITNLILFILVGVLSAINLNYTGDIQILVLGFFFLFNGILELMDPLSAYIIANKK